MMPGHASTKEEERRATLPASACLRAFFAASTPRQMLRSAMLPFSCTPALAAWARMPPTTAHRRQTCPTRR